MSFKKTGSSAEKSQKEKSLLSHRQNKGFP